jgi:hypothetical protein
MRANADRGLRRCAGNEQNSEWNGGEGEGMCEKGEVGSVFIDELTDVSLAYFLG